MMARRRLAPPRSVTRPTGRRSSRARFLVVCEGEATEADYFNGMKKVIRYGPVEVVVRSDRGDPLQLVDVAIARRERAA